MGEIFSEYIGLIAFLIILVFPRIFRMLVTRGGRTPSPIEKSLEDLLQGDVNLPETTPAAVITARRSDLNKIRKRAEGLLAEAEALSSLCTARGGNVAKMKVIVESGAVTQLSALIKDIKRIEARSGPPNAYEIKDRRYKVRTQKIVLGLLDQMVTQRIHPARAQLLGILDAAAKDCLMPYIAHAKRTGAPYKTRFALSIIETAGRDLAFALESTPVAVAIVEPSLAEVPRGWVNLVSDISMDVYYSTKGLSKKLFQTAGAMPPPVTSPHNANANTVIAGLIGACLPRIFGDVGAAFYLGPAAAKGLASTLGRGSEEDRAMVWKIGQEIAEVPMHIRMFAMCRALYYADFGAEADSIWEAWRRRLGNPTELTLKDASGKTTSISTALLLQAALRAVDSIASAPMAPLGNQLLIRIPGLRCTESDRARMAVVAKDLHQGIPVNAPARIIIGAGLAAAEKSPATEGRIGTAALKSMAGKGIASPDLQTQYDGHLSSVHEAAQSPAAVLQAVALSAAFSPRRTL